MSSSSKPVEFPFAASAGAKAPPARVPDWFRALDELMVVVEALCPRWPERPVAKRLPTMRM